eukprot:TRINITY_DN7894_c0_g1_i1.p1 TRINITY_DN7894_c0_g1~~TRINITY_DN7894_c0_g1_i1.p1  ORF type:complete len:480 (-),score=121.33 TRINITY_DN7894_c0_g1_i1:19-1458(-)
MASPPIKKRKMNTATDTASNGIQTDFEHPLIATQELKDQFSSGQPFPHLYLHDFMQPQFLKNVKEALCDSDWVQKNNDLYTFQQTKYGLQGSEHPYISKAKEMLYSEKMRNFLTEVTGIELNDTMDISGSRYKRGDTLLCHDDRTEGRRIAYVLYLVPEDWNEKDGGSLDLFVSDENTAPTKEHTSIYPKWNSFIFFEVSPVSHHRVAEVLSVYKTRYAISGWYHGEPIDYPPSYIEKPLPVLERDSLQDNSNVDQWINSDYLTQQNQELIKEYFSDNSNIGLNDFLVEEKFMEIANALPGQEWVNIGPMDRRFYDNLGRFDEFKETGIVRELKQFLTSTGFINFIENVCSTKVNSLGAGEFRKINPGSYTLVHDNEKQHDKYGIDIILYLKVPNYTSSLEDSCGGFSTYMDSDEVLLSLQPVPNTLSLIFRDEGCMRFVKFFPKSFTNEPIFDFQNTFDVEFEDSGEELDDGDVPNTN